MWWLIGVSAIGSLPVLVFVGRRQDRVAHREWEYRLTARGEGLYQSVLGRIEGDLDLAVLTYTEAFALGERGLHDDALRALEAGHGVVERAAPGMLRLLAAMATFSRATEAMAPVPSLRPVGFRLPPLVALAATSRLLDAVLVSVSERFRVRVYLLGHAYGLAVRYLLRDSERMIRRGSWSAAEWRRLQSIHGDIMTLTDELLRCLRVLLGSLTAVRRDAA
ncbi:MAG: hypothetical protein ACHQNV_07450 [Vicinamibacteria bacterium]